jgi:hypothetical protein
MKKIKSIVSWISFAFIALVVMLASLYAGIMAANYLHDALSVSGWQCLLLAPVVLIVAIITEGFFILGLQQFGTE